MFKRKKCFSLSAFVLITGLIVCGGSTVPKAWADGGVSSYDQGDKWSSGDWDWRDLWVIWSNGGQNRWWDQSNSTLVSISITPAGPSIALGTTQQFEAVGTYSDNTTQDLTASVNWSSSSSALVAISNADGSNGLATPAVTGLTTIMATSGSISASITLIVMPPMLVSLTVTPTDPSIALGTLRQFTATGTYSDNTTQDLTASATWSCSPSAVAAISNADGSNGLATSAATGLATVTASWGSISDSTTLAVTPPTLASISITPTNPGIALGTVQQFTAMGIYTDNTKSDLTATAIWNSSAADAATVGNVAGSNGLATSAATGLTTITATMGSISDSTVMTITPATLVSLSINPANPSVAPGTAQQFTATGTYSDNTTQDLTAAAAWNSSAGAVATVSNAAGSNGLATSAATGLTTITATMGSVSDSTALTITPTTLVFISITPANPSVAPGTAQQFTATGTYSDNTTQDLTAAVAWTSSAGDVATVSNAAGSIGLATSAVTGLTTITATMGSVSDSTALTITPATLVAIAVTPANPSIAVGTIRQFTATGIYSDNTTQDLTAAGTWSSSTSAVAAISNAAGSSGLATSVSAGLTTIAAASGSVSGATTLTVTPATLVSISITPDNPSIALGTAQQFTATGIYSDNTTQNLTAAVTWNSSDSGVASVSNAAASRGLAASSATGSTTITAVSNGILGTATLTVTGSGIVTMTWDAPSAWTDGSPLKPATDLLEYRIYFGTAPGVYTQTVRVSNPRSTTVTQTLTLPSPGTCYFVVTAVDTQGQESGYSNQVKKIF